MPTQTQVSGLTPEPFSDHKTGFSGWRIKLRNQGGIPTPAVANGRVWAGTWDGRIISWDAKSGDVRWAVKVGAPCHWQPTICDGKVFAGLEDGTLLGFDTGDPLESNWPMWGGGPGHNGKT